MKIIDLHQDLMTHIRFKERFGQQEQTSFKMIMDSDLDLVVATAFPVPADDNQYHHSVNDLITEELAMYIDFVTGHDTWSLVKTGADLGTSPKKLLLHIEGLNVWGGAEKDWRQLDAWFEQGVRSIGTHWNLENALGGGTLQDSVGLTALGAEVVSYIEGKKIILDMAHMSRQTFWDVASVVTRPLYVSHGNSAVVCKNIRNYTDEQLSAIAVSDGVIGVFFPNTFVVGRNKQGSVDDVVSHVHHMKKIMGTRHIAIGSDFGGIVSGEIAGLGSVDALPMFIRHLEEGGFSTQEIEDITYNNARRVLESHLS